MTALQTGAGGSGIIVINRDISKLVPLRMELERQSEELAVRDEILRILSRSPGFEVGLGEALERIIQIAGFDCGGIGLVEGDRGTLVPQVQCGIPEALRRDWQREPLRLDEALIRPVMERGKPLIIEDLAHDPRVARPALKESGLRTAVIVPIQVQKRIVGSLFLLDRRPLELPLEGLRLLQAVSDQMGVAVENAELYRELEKRVEQRTEALRTSQERLQALSRVAAMVQGILDEERILALAAGEIRRLGFIGSFWSVERGGQAIVRRHLAFPPKLRAAIRQVTGSDPLNVELPLAQVPTDPRRTVTHGEIVVIDDLKKTLTYEELQSYHPEGPKFLEQEIGGVVYAPLLVHGEPLWLMTLAFPQVTEGELCTTEIFARHLSIALENARLFHDLECSYERLKRVQEGLLQAERLAAIGQLAGSISHHLRNPLGVIRNSVFYLKSKLGDRERKLGEHLELIEEEIRRADRRISDLLALAYRGAPCPRRLQLRAVVERAITETEFPPGIELTMEFDGGPLQIEADPEGMMQVCGNVINNALQAMTTEGRLLIRGYQEGDEVVLEFEDSGSGLPQEEAARVFEPLFTTKAQGTGLGLTICKHVVEAHGGRISFQSREGKGSRVTVWIPKEGAREDG